MGVNLRIPRLSSSAKADDPVITGLGLGHRFGLNHSVYGLLDARLRGHDNGEIVLPPRERLSPWPLNGYADRPGECPLFAAL